MTVNAKSEEDRQRKAMFKKEEGVKDEGEETGDAEVNESDGEPIHEGVSCDGCQMRPIVGTRYKCFECDFSCAIGIFFH